MWITLLFDWDCAKGFNLYTGRGQIRIQEGATPEEARQRMEAMIRDKHGDTDSIHIFHIREATKWSAVED